MCGITGFIEFNNSTCLNVLDAMTNSLRHRGPDDRGTKMFTKNTYQIGLGHRRLSIIDLSVQGNQPMGFRELSIVFNGEIYNHSEIRRELEIEYGCRFASQSDTEVILQAYYQWGIKCVNRFIGMFAIGLYDDREKKFYLIRDRAGVKPLFYYEKDGLFLFASELKSLHAHPGFSKKIDKRSLGFFLQYGYVVTPYSIFKYTKKVLPGHYIEYDLNRREYKESKYWDVFDYYDKPKMKIDYDDALDELERILRSSFNYRMVSDVPVGIFLSGGYDSSSVTALLQKERTERIKTFTIGFWEDKYNEAKYAKKIAEYLGTDHSEYYCNEKDALDIIPELPYFYDEPFGDSSAIPTILVSCLAREQVTVALSADGGDESFAGYTKYHKMQMNLKKMNRLPRLVHRPSGKILKVLNGGNESNKLRQKVDMLADILDQGVSAQNYNERKMKTLSDKNLKQLTGEIIHTDILMGLKRELNGENTGLDHVMAIDYQTYLLDDIIVKVDRATMSVSLEGREPLLDHRIIEFAAQIPTEYKYKDGIKKRILRDLTHKYLPVELMDRPKMGFCVPLERWLRKKLKDRVNFYLDEKRLGQQGIFNKRMVNNIKINFERGEDIHGGLIWNMLMFEMWFEKWA